MDRIRRRGVLIVAVATVVAVTCVALGLWQLRRLDERRARNAAVLRASEAPAVGAGNASDIAPLTAFRRVNVRGSYDVEGEALLYGRALNGEPGHWVLTPLVFGPGDAVLVIRGWVPFSMADRAPVTEAPPIARDVTVRGWLIPAETNGATRPDADGVIRTLDLEGIESRLPYDLVPFALQLHGQDPPPPPFPVQIPLPEPSEGPHLSYAIQWFSFAAIAVIGAAILLRRERRGATAAP
ncbi:MAG TPA: SURF1 family protein [Actinomycetota bacterium]|nr:SURF1 family protein [Actinomycetota bacterium]